MLGETKQFHETAPLRSLRWSSLRVFWWVVMGERIVCVVQHAAVLWSSVRVQRVLLCFRGHRLALLWSRAWFVAFHARLLDDFLIFLWLTNCPLWGGVQVCQMFDAVALSEMSLIFMFSVRLGVRPWRQGQFHKSAFCAKRFVRCAVNPSFTSIAFKITFLCIALPQHNFKLFMSMSSEEWQGGTAAVKNSLLKGTNNFFGGFYTRTWCLYRQGKKEKVVDLMMKFAAGWH